MLLAGCFTLKLMWLQCMAVGLIAPHSRPFMRRPIMRPARNRFVGVLGLLLCLVWPSVSLTVWEENFDSYPAGDIGDRPG